MRYSISKILVVGLVCLFTAVSCKDSSTDSNGNSSPNGLWKLNSTEGDVAYVNITNTQVTFFDYMGDEFDEGEDCYEIELNEVLEINGNTYTFEDPFDPQETLEVEVTVDDDQLTVKMPFGDATVTFNYTKFGGNTNTFTPECVAEEFEAKAKYFIF